jgi:hypothetical protein
LEFHGVRILKHVGKADQVSDSGDANQCGSIWIQVWMLSLSTAFEAFVYGLDLQAANRRDFKDPRFGLDL